MESGTWVKVAPGVFHRRYQPLDIGIVVIVGGAGLLLVDTRSTPKEGAELLLDVGAAFDKPIRWVVNTHAHFDHVFGNQVFGPGSPVNARIYGHRDIVRHWRDYEGPRLAAWRRDPTWEPDKAWGDVILTAPTDLIDDALDVDLGSRTVHLVALPPGHTDTDVVVHIQDAGVWVVGDVVEESGPPMFGSGCFPALWPRQLDHLLGLLGDGDIVLPGHGRPVDKSFVATQRREVAALARAHIAAGPPL
ncbi:MBL fold metallo-hydrolase [Specibacter cremeus]|uniref:MBL fold metallo-hydrolase n=1 Tax=Specibacter cremeus TaxID=1629051 RepID=UPI0013DDCDEE|nr:MBL fold metallo-hydrolase [Specibacter cremeus]